MLILPVIDLLAGLVVRGVAGKRSEYLPISSSLVSDAQPSSVALAFRSRFGFSQIYVADLDAIAGRAANHAAWQDIAEQGFNLWLDAGVGSVERAMKVAALPALDVPSRGHKLIVGLESLVSLAELRRIVDDLGSNRVVFSLDLKAGEVFTSVSELNSLSALQLAERAVACGIQQLILLDLADVGVNQGVGTLELCRQIRDQHPGLQLVAGGGVRSLDDLGQLADAGCCAALVASALHDGRLTAADCQAAQRL